MKTNKTTSALKKVILALLLGMFLLSGALSMASESLSFPQPSKNSSIIILIRHGQTKMNEENRVQGAVDYPLNEKGLEQARDLAPKLVSELINHALNGTLSSHVYAADLQRTKTTAVATIEEFSKIGLPLELVTTPDLREMNFGKAEEMLVSEAKKTFPHAHDFESSLSCWDVPAYTDGETPSQVSERAIRAITKIGEENIQKVAIAFTSGKLMRITTTVVKGLDQLPPPLENGEIIILKYSKCDSSDQPGRFEFVGQTRLLEE